MGMQGAPKVLDATEWPEPKVNSTQSPTAALTLSGVKLSPGPTWTLCTPVAEDPEAVMVDEDMSMDIVEELESSPYWGEARTEVVRAARRNVVDVSAECIFGGGVSVCCLVFF